MATKTMDVDGGIAIAKRALELYRPNAARLADRIDAADVARLEAVIDILERGKSQIPGVRFDISGATLTERQAATALAREVMLGRELVKAKVARRPELKNKLKAFGIGLTCDDGQTYTVVASAEKFAEACVELGEGIRAFGLKTRDGRSMATKALQLKAADTSQKNKQGLSKNATAARDEAVQDAYHLAWEFGAAGAKEFSEGGSDATAGERPDAVLEAKFAKLAEDAVLPSDRDRKKKATEKQNGQPATA